VASIEIKRNDGEKYDSLDRAQQLYEQGKWQEALQIYRHAIRLWPTDAGLCYARGLLYFRLNRYLLAIEDLTMAVGINPDFLGGRVHELRGSAYFELGDYENAIADLTEAIQAASSPDVHVKRGVSYMNTGHHREAAADFEIVAQYGRYEDFASVALGDSYAELGDYQRAIEHYSVIVDRDPFCAWICLRRATAYQKSGNFRAATDDYTRLVDFYSSLIQDDPKQGWVYFTRGSILERMGQHRNAMEDYRRAERL
jgi:tetratricopeptide (TPR) repeat protein